MNEMEEKKIKREYKFIDNIAFKNKFQFLMWINDNVIVQRYFKINGFIDDSIYSQEFIDCMNEIVNNIQKDMESKSRVFLWHTNPNGSTKMTGFVDNPLELDEDDTNILTNKNIVGERILSNGEKINKVYLDYDGNTVNDYGEFERPAEGEFMFKFSFLIDNVTVFEKIWDGNVYPRFVRNGVDLTNNMSKYEDYSPNSLSDYISYRMQCGKENLINDSIRKICDTLSNSFSDKYEYTKSVAYNNTNVTKTDKYDEAVALYGVIKPNVTGHTDIKPVNKRYNFNSALKTYEQSWKRKTFKKTREYFSKEFPLTQGQIDYIERNY